MIDFFKSLLWQVVVIILHFVCLIILIVVSINGSLFGSNVMMIVVVGILSLVGLVLSGMMIHNMFYMSHVAGALNTFRSTSRQEGGAEQPKPISTSFQFAVIIIYTLALLVFIIFAVIGEVDIGDSSIFSYGLVPTLSVLTAPFIIFYYATLYRVNGSEKVNWQALLDPTTYKD